MTVIVGKLTITFVCSFCCIGADPEIKNNSGLHVFYHYGEQRAWLVKNLPGLNCGIWNASKLFLFQSLNYLSLHVTIVKGL